MPGTLVWTFSLLTEDAAVLFWLRSHPWLTMQVKNIVSGATEDIWDMKWAIFCLFFLDWIWSSLGRVQGWSRFRVFCLFVSFLPLALSCLRVAKALHSVRRMMWIPDSVKTGPLISPALSANEASSKGFCIWPAESRHQKVQLSPATGGGSFRASKPQTKTASRQTTKPPINDLQGVFVFIRSQKMIQNNSFTHARTQTSAFLSREGLFRSCRRSLQQGKTLGIAADPKGRGNLFCRLTGASGCRSPRLLCPPGTQGEGTRRALQAALNNSQGAHG